MRHSRSALLLHLLALTFLPPMMAVSTTVAFAQGGASSRGPQFLLAPADQRKAPVLVDAASVAVLRRKVSLQLDGVGVRRALDEISKRSGLEIVYAAGVVPREVRVQLQAASITVAAALTEVLLDAGVDVVLSPGGNAVLVKRVGMRAPGVIAGRITDAKTGEAIVGAEVFLEGTRWRAPSTQTGAYKLDQVSAGTYTLTVRRVGYAKQSKPVTVADGAELTVDMALQPVVTQLTELVSTATGDQRRLEVGHTVGRINADSLVREAPVTNLGELLMSRVPGLQVFQNQGTVGGRMTLRIRGPSSLNLSNQPIVIVDGVRYTTGERSHAFANGGPGDVEPTSPLNDINLNDIEAIEVVKGPSATTLYGTDAANGVIVVATKRGRPGPARWNVYGKATMNQIPRGHLPDIYWGWGTVDGVPNNKAVSCTLKRLASGSCTQQDSITVLPNVWNDPDLTMFASKPRWEYGANVAGGRQDMRYYFSADFENAIGPIQMPKLLADELKRTRGLAELPDEWKTPNSFDKINLRSNISAAIGKTAEIDVRTGYIDNDARTMSRVFGYTFSRQFYSTPAVADTTPYGWSGGRDLPSELFVTETSDRARRFIGNATGRWQPVSWFTTRATLGLDLTNSTRYSLKRPGDQPTFEPQGSVEDTRGTSIATTGDFGATATMRRGRLTARTSAGAQYIRTLSTTSGAYGVGLAPGGSSVQSALTIQTRQFHDESAILGGYLEETFGLNDRLFLTGALRFDGASSFGRDFSTATFPKLGVSWLLSDEPFLPRVPGLEELRVRYAYGVSGKQPNYASARAGYGVNQVTLNGQVIQTVGVNAPGNPDLGPERVREHEFGFDVAAVEGRFHLEATWFRRTTQDLIVMDWGPPGRGSMESNVGRATQHGFEAELRARVLDSRLLSWDVGVQHASYGTKLDDLANGFIIPTIEGAWVEGYPLGARFEQYPVLGGTDANGDGLISSTEVNSSATMIYRGQSLPPKTRTVSTTVGLFDSRLRLSAVVDHKAGFTQVNRWWCEAGTCREAVDRNHTTMDLQARLYKYGGNIEPGDFTRLREVTIAMELPSALARALRISRATLVGTARNLALWTKFRSGDPETGELQATEIRTVGGGISEGIPQSRTFSLRLDLGL